MRRQLSLPLMDGAVIRPSTPGRDTNPPDGTLRSQFFLFAGDFLSSSRRGLPLALTLIAGGALVEGIGILLLVPLLGVLMGDEITAGSASYPGELVAGLIGEMSPSRQLTIMIGIFLALLFVRGVIIVAREVALSRLQIAFLEGKRRAIIRLLASASWEVLARLRHGRITHVLGADVQAVGDAANLLLQATVLAALVAVQLSLLVMLSVPLSLFIFALGTAAILMVLPMLRASRTLGAEWTEAQLALVDRTTQYLGGLKLAVSHDLQQSYVSEFEATLRDSTDRRLRFARHKAVTNAALTLAVGATAAAIVVVGAGPLEISSAVLLAFLLVIARLSGTLLRLQLSLQVIVHALPAYGKLKALEADLAQSVTEPAEDAASGTIAIQHGVRLADVSYTHHGGDEKPAGVAGLSIFIPRGQMIGISGPSGAGKTTFADLVAGLYPPHRGQVTVDGAELSGERLARWRQSISYAPQDSFLFHESIRANLVWARPSSSESEMWEALELAGADTLVRNLGEGLNTSAGERGTLLSGGERQRVALARALVRRPELLVLDEATSAIEPAQEAEILRSIRRAMPNLTIIMIAHRTESLRLCDRVVRLEQGTIALDTAAVEPSPGCSKDDSGQKLSAGERDHS